MSMAVIGGLISSTLLSPAFVRAVFAVQDVGLAWRRFSRFVGPTEEEPAAAPAPALAQPELRPLPAGRSKVLGGTWGP